MISQQDLQALVEFQRSDDLVLSLYLDTDLRQQTKEQCKLIVRERLASVADASLQADVERVERYLDYEYEWRGKGVVLFSCQRHGLWRAFVLSVPVRTQVFVGESPYLKPLTDLMEEHEPYGVVLVDQTGARFFHVQLGQITEERSLLGEEVKHHKQGGWAQATQQRHTDMQVLHNLKAVAEATSRFCRQHHCKNIVLAGSSELVAHFRELLSKDMNKQILGTVPIDQNVSTDRVLERTQDVVQQAKLREEASLVDQMVTAAAKGGAGVIGLADTTYAIRQGRVQTLLVEEGYEVPGALCPQCGYVSAVQGQTCLFCGSEMDPIGNAVDLAVQKALDAGAKVRFPSDNDKLALSGHIGAMLRY